VKQFTLAEISSGNRTLAGTSFDIRILSRWNACPQLAVRWCPLRQHQARRHERQRRRVIFASSKRGCVTWSILLPLLRFG